MSLVNAVRLRALYPQNAPNYSVDIYDDDRLATADWPSIEDPSDLKMHVYQSREFLDVWMNTIGRARGIKCYLIVVRDRTLRPVLYLPLAIETKFNVRLLRFMDAGVADYNAPILAPSCELTRQEFDGLWSEILSSLPHVDAIDLQKVSSDVAGAFNPLTYLDCLQYASSGHSILLSGLRSEVDARPSLARLRRKLRRQYGRLNRIGETNFIVNPDVQKSEQIFAKLIELKQRKYMATVGRDFLAMPGIARFYQKMVTSQRIGTISHLSALTCSSKVVSAHLGFIGRGRFYYTFPAYDQEYRQFSAGHLLLQHLIDQALERGFATFDLGEGDFSYKVRWSTHRLSLYTYERAMTAAGLLYLQIRRARRFLGTSGF